MSSQQTPKGTLSRGAYDALLVHLTRERTWLQSARESLLVVRRSAAVGDLAQLESALREQAVLMAARDELQAARQTLMTQAAQQLGIGAQPATLAVIAGRLSPQARKPIVAARRELTGGARSLRELTRGALAIVSQKRQIVDGVLGELLGAPPTEARYTSDGQRHDAGGRSLLECRS